MGFYFQRSVPILNLITGLSRMALVSFGSSGVSRTVEESYGRRIRVKFQVFFFCVSAGKPGNSIPINQYRACRFLFEYWSFFGRPKSHDRKLNTNSGRPSIVTTCRHNRFFIVPVQADSREASDLIKKKKTARL